MTVKKKNFLDSELSLNEKSKEKAKFHVLPIPLEKTVSCGKGTANGPKAILDASKELERFTGKSEPCVNGIFTHPFLNCNLPLENVIDNIEKTTKEICKQNKIPVILGGEHSITFGAVNGVFKGLNFSTNDEIGIIQIDAHADLRENYEDQVYSHASVMYLLNKSKYKIAQFGVRALSKEEAINRNIFDILYYDVEDIKNNKNLRLPKNFPENVYITFDVDGLDPSIMPATGTPVPDGLGFNESLQLIKRLIKGRKVLGFDVVEFSPIKNFFAYDFTVASLVYRIMELIDLND
ncbi:agmatinase [bacterium]|nr:agmatinase [bacterium]